MYNNNNQHHGGERKQFNKQFQEAASFRKATNDTHYFWDLVNKNRSNNFQNVNKKNLKHEEKVLFTKKSDSAEKGVIDDNIPVERSGPGSEEVGVLQSFAELENSVPSFVTSNIALMHYDRPTPIQKHSIPLGLAGLDLMCCAQTGSGKTFAFLLPVVAILDRPHIDGNGISSPAENNVLIDNRGALPRCIILAPTRELASQIHLDARRLTFNSKLKAICVYGGNDLRSQLVELASGCDIIVATPGRLNDLVERGVVSLGEVKFLILDEADRMLDMGFEPQIRRIVGAYDMPRRENRQTFLFSATFPGEIQTLAREFLREYVWIGVGRVGSTVENIKQNLVLASANPNEKIKLLLTAIDLTPGRTLVFVQKRLTASWLCQCLNNAYGITAEEIHGDRTQMQRENALRQFRDGHIRILVATDVAARGLDVPAVTHVIQFDMPLSTEDFDVYVHRIGRTGRAGMSGMATSFFVPGREVGEGNGKIAQSILRLLQENKQDIPEWFSNLDDLRGGNFRSGGGHKKPYQQHGNGGHAGGNKFGWRDVRGNQNNSVYGGGTGYGGNNQQQQQQFYQQPHQNGYQQPAPYGHQQQSQQYGRPNANASGYGNYQQQQQPQQQRYNRPGQYGSHQGQQQNHSQQQQHYGGPVPHAQSSYGAGYGHMSQQPQHNPYDPSALAAAQTQGYYDQFGVFVPVGVVDGLADQFGTMVVAAAPYDHRGGQQGRNGASAPHAYSHYAGPSGEEVAYQQYNAGGYVVGGADMSGVPQYPPAMYGAVQGQVFAEAAHSYAGGYQQGVGAEYQSTRPDSFEGAENGSAGGPPSGSA